MTVEIISQSISMKVWDQAGIKLSTPGSAVRLASVKRQHLKRWNIGFQFGFQDQLALNAGQKVLQNAPMGAFISFVIKIFVLSIFEWQFYTGFTV